MSAAERHRRALWSIGRGGAALRRDSRRAIERAALVAIFGVSGIVHLAAPRVYGPIMPPWLPAPLALISLSGVCELLGAAGLLLLRAPLVRRLTRVGLVALLFAVFPANAQMALNGLTQGAPPLVLALEIARLPLQWVLIMLVLDVTDATGPHAGR